MKTPSLLDKYFSRVIVLLILGSSFYLFGCNSTASPGREYVGTWEYSFTSKNSRIGSSETALATHFDILTISQDGDHFVIKETKTVDDGFGKTLDLGTHTHPATVRSGILQLADGSSRPYTYVKATDTLITHGAEHDIEYHRRKQQSP